MTTGASDVGYLKASSEGYEFDGPFVALPRSSDAPRVKENAQQFIVYAMLAPTILNMQMPPKAAKTLYWIKALGGTIGDSVSGVMGAVSG